MEDIVWQPPSLNMCSWSPQPVFGDAENRADDDTLANNSKLLYFKSLKDSATSVYIW